MHIEHHGGSTGVTGSCHQLYFSDTRSVLIDCGIFQGADARRVDSMSIDFPIDGIEGLILTHVHIDHVGRIPYLLEAGFHKPIYCTKPTAKLLPTMLEDAMRLGITRNRRVIKEVLDEVRELLRPTPYGEWRDLGHGEKIRFQQAGHILGSAYVEIEHKTERFVFSGDLGSRGTPILIAPESPERADVLVLESTYGDRIHEGRETRMDRLEAILCETLDNKGVTLIPAFSLGRTQELLYELNHILEEIGRKLHCSMLKQIDIIVDSPMALKLNEIYDSMQEHWSEEARDVLTVDNQPLVFKNLVEIDASKDHLAVVDYLRRTKKPAVVIAGSGMCTGGRIVDYLREFLGEETTDVLFVGYQSLGTPGRAIQECSEGKCDVRVGNQNIHVKAKTYTLTGYSAHADQLDLIKFVENIPVKPREIRLVHGETPAKIVLAEKLTKLGYVVTWEEDTRPDGSPLPYPDTDREPRDIQ